MARTRYIKPGFFQNDRLAELGPWHRLLFAGLWTIADRAGRLEDRPKRIKGELFPYDDVDVEALLADLSSGADPFVVRYEANGVRCLCLPKWSLHQKPHNNEAASVLPSHRNHKKTEEKQEFEPKYERSTTKERTEDRESHLDSHLNENLNENSNSNGEVNGDGEPASAVPPAWREPAPRPKTNVEPRRNHAKCFNAPAACARGLCLPQFLGEQWQAQIATGQPEGFSASGVMITRVNAIVDAWPIGKTVDDLLPWWRQQWKFTVPMMQAASAEDWYDVCGRLHDPRCPNRYHHETRMIRERESVAS